MMSSAFYLNRKTAAAGLQMAHQHKIALAFRIFGAHPDGTRAQAPEKLKILRAFEHLRHFDDPYLLVGNYSP